MCGVRGRIFHELEVVFKALVLLCSRGTEPLIHASARDMKKLKSGASLRCDITTRTHGRRKSIGKK